MDSPLHEKNPSKTYFDEEGTNTKNLEIIKNGVLTTFIHSTYTAKKFLTQSTGHANLGSKVTVSPHFFHILSTNNSEVTRNIDTENNIIYIESVKSLHAGVNALQGSFSLPFNGFLVSHGKKESIESATVAGDFFTLLQDICYLGAIEEVTTSGVSPEIWVKQLSITGNEN